MNRWDDQEDEAAAPPFKPLTREEALALRAKEPPLSPWWVIGVQVAVGVVAALLAAWVTGRQEVAWSVLYGAATVVVPGALMARGMTSSISSASPGHERCQRVVMGDGQDSGFRRDAGHREPGRAAAGLAGVVAGSGALHEGLPGGADLAPPAVRMN
jgi:hypothetical protein